MGSVYRAKQRSLDTMFAVKVLRITLLDRAEALQRFYGEAKNTSKLKHPHNIRVFDFGHTDDGLLYIVMELVRGTPLSKLQLPISSARTVDIGG